jgi:membrane protein
MPAGASWWNFLKRLVREIGRDDLFGLASQCAFAAAFALFPFLLFVVAISVDLLPKRGDQPVLPPELESQMPAEIQTILDQRLDEVAHQPRAGALTFALVLTLYSAGSGMSTLVSAINRAYDVEEKRPFYVKFGIGVILVLAGAVLLILPSLTGILGGIAGKVLSHLGMGDLGALLAFLRWPVLAAGAFAWLMLLFRLAPETSKRWRIFTPGAVVAVIGLIAANIGLSVYLEHTSSMTVTYGAIGGFVAFLLWLYVCSAVLLLGAEVNATLEQIRRERPLPPVRGVPGFARPAESRV